MRSKTFDLIYQNFFLKSIVILIAMIGVNLHSNLYFLFLGSFIYFLPFVKYLKYWLKSMLFLLPFFISYLILGLIFNSDFLDQLRFILKICFLILMSVYFIRSLNVERILTDVKWFLRFGLIKKIIIFLLALLEITPLFYENFQSKKRQNKSKNISVAIHIFSKTFTEVFSKLDEIEIKVMRKMVDFKETKSSIMMNLYSLIMFITIYLSIK